MEKLPSLVVRAQGGDLDAYGQILRRFQDMAYGYAYAILGDFHRAEDVAQEAFIRAYRDLQKLDDPATFPGWFRRIVFKYCDRRTRRKGLPTVPLQSVGPMQSDRPGPLEKAQKREMAEKVLQAIRALPEKERTVTTLYYINGYSQKEVADFLELPVATVNNRLHASRKRLKERMIAMVADELKGSRPDREFKERVMRVVSRVEVRPEKSPEDSGRVLLVAEDGRCLPVVIGKAEEAAIHRAVTGQEPPRPLTHELFLSALEAFGISVKETRVTELRDGTFIGECVLERDGEERVLDARPSDAVALAIMTDSRVSVAEKVLSEAATHAIEGKEVADEAWDKVFESGAPGPRGPARFDDEELPQLCRQILGLNDKTLRRLARRVGPETFRAALEILLKPTESAEPESGRGRIVLVLPTARLREGLPQHKAEPLESLVARLDEVRIDVHTEHSGMHDDVDAVLQAREKIRVTLQALEERGGQKG